MSLISTLSTSGNSGAAMLFGNKQKKNRKQESIEQEQWAMGEEWNNEQTTQLEATDKKKQKKKQKKNEKNVFRHFWQMIP